MTTPAHTHGPEERCGPGPELYALGLLHPAVTDERQREQRPAETFESLMRIDGRRTAPAEPPALGVLGGLYRINEPITAAKPDASRELFAVQPYDGRSPAAGPAGSPARDQAPLDRGGRIRTLYQHTQRHSPAVVARYEVLTGDAEARTLDQVTIAGRLGMNIRTARVLPQLAATAGSESRARLGHLIGRPGILEQEAEPQ